MLPVLRRHSVAPFAISYDSLAVLADFAARHGIGYPLLSDEGSHTMRRLGLINARVQEDHAAYGVGPNPRHVNLPYPGVFVLDETGVILQKRFYESYRERDTGAGLLGQALGILDARAEMVTTAYDEAVRVRAWLDAPSYAMFQRLHLTVELAIGPGLPLHASPAPAGYTPLAVEIAPIDGLVLRPATWPDPRPFRIAGRTDDFWGHGGVIRGTLPLAFTAPPGAGDQILKVTVRYQACSELLCRPSATIGLELPVKETALVDRTLPPAKP